MVQPGTPETHNNQDQDGPQGGSTVEMILRSIQQTLRRLSDSLNAVATYVVFLLITAMILVITLQVIMRVFFTAGSWTEELARYLLVWSSFTAATIGFKRKAHIAVTFVVSALPQRVASLVRVAAYVLTGVFFAVGIVYGVRLSGSQIFQVSPALGLPMRYVYLVIPASFAVAMIHVLSHLVDEISPHAGE